MRHIGAELLDAFERGLKILESGIQDVDDIPDFFTCLRIFDSRAEIPLFQTARPYAARGEARA